MKGQTGLMNILRSLALDKIWRMVTKNVLLLSSISVCGKVVGQAIPGVTLPLCLKVKNPGLIQSEHC